MKVYHGGYCPIEIPEIMHPTHQINFCTAEAVKCLTFIKSEEIKV